MEVFVPTWNSARTLDKCLLSIEVAVPKCEITLYDRHSSDATLKIARQHGVSVVSGTLNLGQARSMMCFNATGEEFVMVDSDTYLNPQWLKKLRFWEQRINDPKLACLQGENICLYEPYRKYLLLDRALRKYPLKNPRRLLSCNVLLKTKVAQDFETDAYVYEDWLLGQHILKKGFNFYVVPVHSQHDAYRSKTEIWKHARWGMSGQRIYGHYPFWKIAVGLIYFPLFKVPVGRKLFTFTLETQWLVGWLFAKRYLDLKRERGFN
jgi:glycosyltransferase involved in cell wall biosynthesis